MGCNLSNARILVALVAFAGSATALQAEENDIDSGKGMLPICAKFLARQDRDGQSVGFDDGYCVGAMRTLVSVMTSIPNSRICLPDPVPLGRALQITVQYMQSHPEDLHGGFTSLAIRALREAWPCK